MTDYPAHPAAEIFPMMPESELAELAEDIRKNGLIEPIAIFEGMVLDGRNRLAACKLAGVEPRFATPREVTSPTLFVMSRNLHRRHLTTSQRAAIAAEIMPMLAAEAKERQRQHGGTAPGRKSETLMEKSTQVLSAPAPEPPKGTVRDIAGKTLGVSGFSVGRAAEVKKASPETFERVKRGEITVGAAHRQAVQAKPAVTKRQQQIENATKRRMIEALSQVRGLCKGLGDLNVSTAAGECTREDLKTWAGVAREASKCLRLFADNLTSCTPGKENEAA